MRKFDLEDRLIDFAVLIINTSTAIENSKAGGTLSSQLL